ncbi:UNKNOWN [Stylonychia lemnae]|uniref:Macro domain-containing protein n=1 Tax=Stylonychia lemnae TaxID=5949 RepID=A0A078ADT5_STYLE|nr:UNKNOWN [Stylonychia lemnae]|eukprot:CDW79702.1 UNKNOWN [Stylonychia lemnae]
MEKLAIIEEWQNDTNYSDSNNHRQRNLINNKYDEEIRQHNTSYQEDSKRNSYQDNASMSRTYFDQMMSQAKADDIEVVPRYQANKFQQNRNQKSASTRENNYEEDTLSFQMKEQNKVLLGGWLEVSVNFGDITNEQVDAITNAANEFLSHSGGLPFAISKKGGPSIQHDSNLWVNQNGKVETGTGRAVTKAGNMTNCKYVIHAVGPIWTNGRRDDEKLLYDCVTDTLKTASKLNCRSVSIPAISSGIFGFPKDLCAAHLFRAAEDFCFQNDQNNTCLRIIRFTNFDQETVSIFTKEIKLRYTERFECVPLTGTFNEGSGKKKSINNNQQKQNVSNNDHRNGSNSINSAINNNKTHQNSQNANLSNNKDFNSNKYQNQVIQQQPSLKRNTFFKEVQTQTLTYDELQQKIIKDYKESQKQAFEEPKQNKIKDYIEGQQILEKEQISRSNNEQIPDNQRQIIDEAIVKVRIENIQDDKQNQQIDEEQKSYEHNDQKSSLLEEKIPQEIVLNIKQSQDCDQFEEKNDQIKNSDSSANQLELQVYNNPKDNMNQYSETQNIQAVSELNKENIQTCIDALDKEGGKQLTHQDQTSGDFLDKQGEQQEDQQQKKIRSDIFDQQESDQKAQQENNSSKIPDKSDEEQNAQQENNSSNFLNKEGHEQQTQQEQTRCDHPDKEEEDQKSQLEKANNDLQQQEEHEKVQKYQQNTLKSNDEIDKAASLDGIKDSNEFQTHQNNSQIQSQDPNFNEQLIARQQLNIRYLNCECRRVKSLDQLNIRGKKDEEQKDLNNNIQVTESNQELEAKVSNELPKDNQNSDQEQASIPVIDHQNTNESQLQEKSDENQKDKVIDKQLDDSNYAATEEEKKDAENQISGNIGGEELKNEEEIINNSNNSNYDMSQASQINTEDNQKILNDQKDETKDQWQNRNLEFDQKSKIQNNDEKQKNENLKDIQNHKPIKQEIIQIQVKSSENKAEQINHEDSVEFEENKDDKFKKVANDEVLKATIDQMNSD